jgi:hypothetical protein
MGYGPKDLGNGVCTFSLSRNDYRIFVRVVVTTDGRYLYVTTSGKRIERPAEMPARFWKRLLVQNDGTSSAGMFWTFYKADRALELLHHLPNRGVTPAKLRKAINALHDLAKKNDEIWATKEPDFVPIVDSPADAKERSKLEGRWETFGLISAGVKATKEQIEKDTKGKKLEIVFGKSGGTLQLATLLPFVSRFGPEVGRMAIYVGDAKTLMMARYKLEKDVLLFCWDANGVEYPPTFESTRANGFYRLEMKRVEK